MNKVKFLAHAAIIAALYAVLTVALAPISYGLLQVRISEALTVLPFFTPAAIPGLFVGCVVANMLGPYGMADIVAGSMATLIAAAASYALRKKPVFVPLPPVAANAVIIGTMLFYVYKVPASLLACIAWVGAGELLACYGLGYPLMKYLMKYDKLFKL